MDPLTIAGAIAVLAAGVAGLAYLVRGLWRAGRRVGHALDDILGVGETPSRPPRPGFGARLRAIEERLDKHLTRHHTERV